MNITLLGLIFILCQMYFLSPWFSRATREGSNAGRAPLGVLTGHRDQFDWTGDRSPHHDSEAIIYELHVKGFTKHPSSGVHPSRAGTYAGLVEKLPYLKDLGITVVELMPIFQRDTQEGDYWGYMRLKFFAPHAQYGSTCDDNGQHLEFKAWGGPFTKLECEDSRQYSARTPILLAEDFNLDVSSGAVAVAISRAQFQDAFADQHRATTPDSFFADGRTDWIFSRGPFRPSQPQVHRSVSASDHDPLSATFDFA